ncbi:MULTISPECIES: YhgE/Pip domain-containing protein [Oerskovia]|uniref:YhgE/Pip domain-containing protein n=1 Tax=Oerskovia rustica TaxID=2762237 RepID=A0ABR8RU98_9CELL|nr:YhgE/Pip domain-containing protein [Oerskovia rustica]MBD7951343.1 YhgE/Pip domain-containing protein [Oerskovia rustica]
MTAVRLGISELRRISAGTLPKLAILAMIVIPTLYSGLYLFANEDPYDKLAEVPAALVVQDRGTTVEDSVDGTSTEKNFGEEVAKQLVDGDGGFGWVETTQSDAEAGVRSGRFDAALVIGPTFSQDLASSGRFEPQQASLVLITNDANNYLVATIADTIVGTVRDAIAEQVGTEAADTFLKGFASIHTNLASGVEGAQQLVDGATQLSDGTAQLVDGTARLATGASEAASGAARLADGADELSTATGTLASGAATLSDGLDTLRSRTANLPAQTQELADGAQQVADGNALVAGYGQDAAAAARDVVGRLDTARVDLEARLAELVATGVITQEEADAVTQVLEDARGPVEEAAATVEGAAGKLGELGAGSAQVAAGAATLAGATPALTQGIATAASGGDRLAAGAAELDDGAGTLASGAEALASGTSQVSDGAAELASSSVTLRDGTAELQSGTTQLHDGLAAGLGRIPDVDEQTQEDTAKTLGNPVAVQKDTIANAGTYGAGLAPFFLSLAAWIGAYVLFLLVRPLSARSLAAGRPAWQTALGGWIPPAVIGVAQVALMFTVVKFALDIDPVYAVGTAVLLVLASATFVAILQALNVYLGAVGQFLGLVLMLVQLVTAGGTFPWQTIPEPLRALHRFLPMSYTVEGLRQLLYGGDLATVARDVGVLLVVLAVALAATTFAAHRQRVWSPTRLQPELVL